MPMKIRTCLAAALILFSTTLSLAQSPRTQEPLDGRWKFHLNQIKDDVSSRFDDSQWQEVSVPHSWPAEGSTLPNGNYRGRATYRRSFSARPEWRGKSIFLRFDGVSLVADVYLNGQHIGQHKGGFAAFAFDISKAIRFDEPNVLAVRVDNESDPDLSPLGGDFTIYGGIYRHVSLLTTNAVDINPLDFASPGVFLEQKSVDKKQAIVDVRTEIANRSGSRASMTVIATVSDQENHVVAMQHGDTSADADKIENNLLSITLANPHLWNGVKDPYLYSVQIDLVQHGRLIDRVIQPLGLRSFHVDPLRGFILNEQAQQIHGVCLHQEGATTGWAVSAEDERHDMQIIREMGADGIRLVHYQHSQSFLDLADRTGMLIWAELAQVERVSPSGSYRANIRQQLIELIRQNYNHPSIFAWSLYNELNSPTKQYSTPLIAELNQLAHAEDASRPTTGAASADTIANLHEMVATTDLIALNNYPGWYTGLPADMGPDIDKWNSAYGNRGIAVTEYGAGASIHQHKADVTKQDIRPGGRFHPEEWQAIVHEETYRPIPQRPYVWGSFLWVTFDFGSFGRHEGESDGVNDKGIIERDHVTRKDAYFFYQANWTTKPMIHLNGCRDLIRTTDSIAIKAYSNQSSLRLMVNGTEVGKPKTAPSHIFHWEHVPLSSGTNTIVVTTPQGLMDSCVWTFKTSLH